MFNDFQNILNLNLTGAEITVNLAVSLLCGLTIAFFYRISYKGPGYSVSYLNSLIVLVMITAMVIMVIGNNLARAFGLVGAMSIIRFRTAVKDTMDIIFIFFSLAVGMAAGVGFHSLAIAGTVIIGMVLFVLSKTNMNSPVREETLLQFVYDPVDDEKDPAYQPVMENACKRFNLVSAKSAGSGNKIELSFYIQLRRKRELNTFIKQLKSIKGVDNVNVLFDEEYF